MRDLCSVLGSRKVADEDMDEGVDDEKFNIAPEETGFFIYHKGRMTRALERVKLMTKQTNAGQTSKLRVTNLGVGLTGFIQENYLVQTHNKAAYLDRKLFDALMSNVNMKAKDYLRRYTGPAHGRVMGYVPAGIPQAAASSSKDDEVPAPKEKGAPKEKPIILEEEVRMRPLNPNDPTVGRVVRAPFSKGCYHLRLPTSRSKRVTARDLVKTVFDPAKDLDPGMRRRLACRP